MNSAFVITDSGGLQEEAYFCAKRALVVMPDTGWRELVGIGSNVLVDFPKTVKESIDESVLCSMTSKDLVGVYGKGEASCRIVQDRRQWYETNYASSDVTLDED